jgi:hypothetical protein
MSRLLLIFGQNYILRVKRIIAFNLNKLPFIKGLNLVVGFLVKLTIERRLEQTCTL